MAGVTVRTSRSSLYKKIQADLVGTLTMYFGDNYHVNFMTGKSNKSTSDIAEILIKGKKGSISARPVFREFAKAKKSEIEALMRSAYAQRFKKGTNMRDVLYDYVAPKLKELFAEWVQTGNVRPYNKPDYAVAKERRVGTDAPFYAKGAVVDSLEVEVE